MFDKAYHAQTYHCCMSDSAAVRATNHLYIFVSSINIGNDFSAIFFFASGVTLYDCLVS
jgi:hypothetical protein